MAVETLDRLEIVQINENNGEDTNGSVVYSYDNKEQNYVDNNFSKRVVNPFVMVENLGAVVVAAVAAADVVVVRNSSALSPPVSSLKKVIHEHNNDIDSNCHWP